MKLIYTGFILLFLIIMLTVVQRAKRKNDKIAKSMIRLIYSVCITVLSSLCAIILPSEPVALFMQSLHYASTEWTLIFLLMFFEEYTYSLKGKQPVKIAVYLYSGITSLILLSNIFFNHVIYCEYVDIDGISCRVFRTYSPWYEIHAYFSYLIAAFALFVLLVETIKAKSFYRKKYLPAVVALVITFAMEGICSASDSTIDYALFGYMSLGIFLTYYSVYYVNNRLIANTLSYVTTENSGGVVCFDITDRCIYANEVAFSLYEDAKTLADFETIFEKYKYGKDVTGKKWMETFEKDGNKHYFEINYGILETEKNDYVGCFFYLYDKTEDIIKLEEARYQVEHDELTGLYNSTGFSKAVLKLKSECPDEELYILTADIKDFKLINDKYGYETGDKVLKSLAEGMKNDFPEYAPLCRSSADHFYFCIKKDDYMYDKSMIWKDAVSHLIDVYDLQIVMHYGVYQIRKEDNVVGIMCDYARMAMNRIKDSYDTFVEFFDMSMMDETLRIKDMVKNYDLALENKQFKMFLQPQVLPGGKVIGAEALVRWEDPVLGIISPGSFIPIFEKIGLIYKLDEYIWEEAVKQLNRWKGTERDSYHISVNISTKDFKHIDVYQTFVDLVEKYDVSPSKLKLEITESAFMKEPEKQIALIERLQKYGFSVEIDDFGSGFSSLNILKDMKANVLKIDMGFLRKTKETERSKAIIDSVIKMAKVLDMKVVSEGVEEKEQVEFLTESGCDIFQGYYFDRPIPVSEFEKKY